jgi:hypothetical protein
MGYNITKEQVLQAIKGSAALITTIQKRLSGIVERNISWHTAQNYTEEWEETREAMEAERQTNLDVAEGTIIKEIYANNVEVSKWYLRMKGKERGYEDTAALRLDGTDPLNINLTGDTMTAEELAKSSDVEITGDGE